MKVIVMGWDWTDELCKRFGSSSGCSAIISDVTRVALRDLSRFGRFKVASPNLGSTSPHLIEFQNDYER